VFLRHRGSEDDGYGYGYRILEPGRCHQTIIIIIINRHYHNSEYQRFFMSSICWTWVGFGKDCLVQVDIDITAGPIGSPTSPLLDSSAPSRLSKNRIVSVHVSRKEPQCHMDSDVYFGCCRCSRRDVTERSDRGQTGSLTSI